MKKSLLFWFFGLFLSAAPAAHAAIPDLINFQGRLTTTAGAPVTTTVPVVFRLFTASTGGSPVYTETHSVTPDADGVYSADIGSVTPLTGVNFDQPLYLGVTVNGETLSARERLTASPYALQAGAVDWARITNVPAGFSDGTDDGVPAAASLTDVHLSTAADINPGKINGGSFQADSYTFPAGSTLTVSNLVASAPVTLSSVSIGGGAPIIGHLSAAATLSFSSIAILGSCENQTINVPGAVAGDPVALGLPAATAVIDAQSFYAYVSAANTVTVKRCSLLSLATLTATAGTFRVDVWRH